MKIDKIGNKNGTLRTKISKDAEWSYQSVMNLKTLVPLNSVTIADVLAAIAEQGDQFEYTALKVWISESIGRVRARAY